MSDFPMAQSAQTASRSKMKFKYIMLLLLFAFAGGASATWWLADSFGILTAPGATDAVEADGNNTQPSAANVAPVYPSAAGMTAQVEGQVVPVYVTDSVISSDALRGEGLLLTYAVRRTLDNGAPLGNLAEQLQLRFGATQPQAVRTVISAAKAPVTIANLQTELGGLAPELISGNREDGVWAMMTQELSQLFVLRRDGVAALAPEQRLIRAQALVEGGKMAAAMQEVAAMPGASAAQSWLVRAKRYTDARKALDRLEQMALIRPVVVPTALPTATEAPAPKASQGPL
jgi:hypothetical protein